MMLLDPGFREGFAPLGLSFEAWMCHTQLPELRDLADAFPDTRIVLNHVGGALGIGPYEARRRHVGAAWSAAIRELSHLPNLSVKLGGTGMRLFGFGFHEGAGPPTSERLAAAWRPYVETCVEAFGAHRRMGAIATRIEDMLRRMEAIERRLDRSLVLPPPAQRGDAGPEEPAVWLLLHRGA